MYPQHGMTLKVRMQGMQHDSGSWSKVRTEEWAWPGEPGRLVQLRIGRTLRWVVVCALLGVGDGNEGRDHRLVWL